MLELIKPVAPNRRFLAVANEIGLRIGRGFSSEGSRGPHYLPVRTARGHSGIATKILDLPVHARPSPPLAGATGIRSEFPAQHPPGKAHF